MSIGVLLFRYGVDWLCCIDVMLECIFGFYTTPCRMAQFMASAWLCTSSFA